MPGWYVASGPGVDGPAPDDDRGLLLTTNRADLLEPAPAARPGRVDQAVELTLPDRDPAGRSSTSTGATSRWTSPDRTRCSTGPTG